MSEPRIVIRSFPSAAYHALLSGGIHPVLARVFAARGVDHVSRLECGLSSLLPFDSLGNCRMAAKLLGDALAAGEKILIVADYDADGATACALGVSVLRALGGDVEYLVPNRFEFGYGLTPEIVALAAQRAPRWLITVDNGIASVDGVNESNRRGIKVLVTDHHLPGASLPDAACIVNPNQPQDAFASKHLAGVGVMFYVLLGLRAELRARGWFRDRPEPNLADRLDLVALGTVADVVRLDDNNRTLVTQGLRRIRAGRLGPGLAALFRAAGRDPRRASTYDLGFALGPRLNAAGRLTDMALGIECLLAADGGRASELAAQLDSLNLERRDIEAEMQETALSIMQSIDVTDRAALSLFDDSWHQGVIGILAARLRERYHRPVIAFAPAGAGELKGSGRSIPGLHLRDALDLVSKRNPNLIVRFGGHAMAAGLTLRRSDVGEFSEAFEQAVSELLDPGDLEQIVEVDGSLSPEDCSLDLAQAIEDQVWGQGFAQPRCLDEFEVIDQHVVGGRHLKLRLRSPGSNRTIEAIRFGEESRFPVKVQTVYRLQVNEFNRTRSPQLVVERWRPA
ncbi:MAG: single-stranded-DNA-specific exonuclease RecJ [Burkholderiales bacterium]